MSITTKRGDRGRTQFCYGGTVSKDSVMMEACGTIDELSSHLGMSKSIVKSRKIKNMLRSIQKDLFAMAAEVATKPHLALRLKKRIGPKDVQRLEENIAAMEKNKASSYFCFYLPGSSLVSSILDVSRTIARRAERRIVRLMRGRTMRNKNILVYLNRLSDLLFLFARDYEKNTEKRLL